MNQKILTIDIDGETITSKPWDFEAMCLIDDVRAEEKGPLRMGQAAVHYLFEGTKATDDVLNSLSIQKLTALCRKAYSFYIDDMREALKNEERPQEAEAGEQA